MNLHHDAGEPISPLLSDNRQRIMERLAVSTDLTIEPHRFGPEMAASGFVVYFSSLVCVPAQRADFFQAVLQSLVPQESGPADGVTAEDIIRYFGRQGTAFQSWRLCETMEEAIDAILNGSVVIFLDTWNRALCFDARSPQLRQVDEPVAESVVSGPREGTVEEIGVNMALIRKRLKSAMLRLEGLTVGDLKKTDIVYGYVEGCVEPSVLAEFKRRLGRIDSKTVLGTSFIEELIEDSTLSPFPQYRYTERPDVAVAALLAGKIIVLVDGTGMILVCPGLFVEFFQSSEDYYQRSLYASLIRFLRISAFLIALFLPSTYIAISTYHPELIPTVLLLAILNSREGIPFSSFTEAFIMEFFFELLREAGIRLPRPVGSAVSIVGALIIGQAAIQAGIASPVVVMVVALTGIASFSLPQYNIAISLRVLRFPFMLLAASLGGFGVMIGFLLLLLHLINLRTLGQPYLWPVAPLRPRRLKDVFVRLTFKNLLRSSMRPKADGGR